MATTSMVPMYYRHRASIDSLPGYRQGSPAPAVPGLTSYKISSNENPYPPLPGVLQTVSEQALGHLNRYPDMRGTRLVERLARLHGVDPACIQLGCGSTEVITQLVDLVAGHGDQVVYPWRSFEAYPIIITMAGATGVPVPLDRRGRHDIEAMIAAVNEHTRLVIVNNPNNPTATNVDRDQAERLLQALPSDLPVLFDEAYIQFNDDPDRADGLSFMREHPNVIVARTFSKAYGLAGLRIGYAVAAEPIIAGMNKVALPFGVTDVAQSAAMASLDAQDRLAERVQALKQERTRILAGLKGQGWKIPEPRANYYWLPLGPAAARADRRFRDAGLSVRTFPGEGIRITVGEREANDRVLEVCADLRRQGLPQDPIAD